MMLSLQEVYFKGKTMADLITMGAAIIGGATGAFNLWRSYSSESDSILVRWGSYKPMASQSTDLYVINLGKHPVQLSDYGFINSNGKMFSIPWYNDTERHADGEHSDDYHRGTTLIQPRDMFAMGLYYHPETIGVYALTTTQNRPRISMKTSLFRPLTFYRWLTVKFFPYR